jgi:VWFA-related protein
MRQTYNLARICTVMTLLEFSMPAILAQEKPAGSNIKVQTSNVVVDLIVTDRHGHHVPGLTAADFTIYEDGVPQKIIGFTPPGSPVSEGSSPAVTAVQGANLKTGQQTETTSPHDPHLLTVVLDLADNTLANTKNSSEAVVKYLEKSAISGDYVAIYYIDQNLHMALPFTNDLGKARETLKRIESRRSTGTFSGVDRAGIQEEINDLYRQAHPETALGALAGDVAAVSGGGSSSAPSGPANNLSTIMDRQIDTMRAYLTMANMFQARAVFAALRAICFAYRDMPGRKNVVLFSEGFLYTDDVKQEMDAVADAANLANVSIYVIDPEGIQVNPYGAGSRPTDTIASKMNAAGAPGANVGQHGGETKFDKIKQVGNFTRGDQLERLADITGGFMVKRTNDLVPAFNKVLDDARDYYALAYMPEKKESDGKFHTIKVELPQQHSYQLRYRKGYWAISRGQGVAMSPAAAQLLAGFQNGSLKASAAPEVHAELLLAPDGHYAAPVSVTLPGNKIPLEKDGDEYKAGMTLILVARDAHGNLLSVSQKGWNMRLSDKQKADFEKTAGVTVHGQVPVSDPQPLSIEAILQLSGNTLARGGTTIPMPDPAGSGFRLTSILLSNRAEQASCSDTTDPLCFMNVRLYQPPQSRFPSSTRLIAYFAASDLSLDPQTKKPRIGAVFTMKSGNTVVTTAAAENLQSFPGTAPNSVLVLAEFDLKSLQPGSYTLQALVRDLVHNTTLSQQSQFVVE